MRAKFAEAYASIGAVGLTETEYTDQLLDNYVATYQMRAAVSLGDIGGRRARNALNRAVASAISRGYRADVLQVIESVRDRVGVTTYAGTVTPARVHYGDVVAIAAPPGQPFTRDALASLDGSPFPPDAVLVSRTSDTLRFFAVGDAGSHVITMSNPATATTTTIAPLEIASILDPNDRVMISCLPNDVDCVAQQAPDITNLIPGTALPLLIPHTAFLSLWRTGPRPDTLDYFKIQLPVPSSSMPVTAVLHWPGTANLDLLWRQCSPYVPTGNTAGATQDNPERTTVLIGAGECWILQVSLAAGEAGPVFARLTVTSANRRTEGALPQRPSRR